MIIMTNRINGRILRAVLALFVAFFSVSLAWGASPDTQNRGIVRVDVTDKDGSTSQMELYSGYHALVVGCGDYTNGWPVLQNPVKDAEEVAGVLKEMGWQVDVLKDPNWATLRRALNELILEPGRDEKAAVLVWFSGHGHTLEETGGKKLGYIVPVDAPDPEDNELGFMEKAISMRQIETVARRMNARHVLMVFDSCFSGAIFQAVKGKPSSFIQEKVTMPVRQFITAGSEEESVPDPSVFKTVFIQGIKDGLADRNNDCYVTGLELGDYLQEKVINYSQKNQHPQFGMISDPNLDKGDFVFSICEDKDFGQDIETLEAERRVLEARLKEADARQSSLNTSISRLKEKAEKIASQKERMERNVTVLDVDVKALTAKLTDKEEELGQLEAKYKKIKETSATKIAEIREELEALQEELDRIDSKIRDLKDRKTRLEASRNDSQDLLASLTAELEPIKERTKALKEVKDQLFREKEAAEQQLMGMNQELSTLKGAAVEAKEKMAAELPKLEEELESVQAERQTAALDIRRLDQEIENLKQKQTGRLFVTTRPADARVRFVHDDLEYRPGMVVKPGEYRVEISKNGHRTALETVTVMPGRDNRVAFKLEPLTGNLYVETSPSFARVEFISSSLTYKRGMELDVGNYGIRVSYDGYQTEEVRFEINPGQEKTIRVELEPLMGRLYVRTDPADATVELVDSNQRFRDGMSLPAGQYQVTVEQPWYTFSRRWLAVEPGRDNRYTIHLRPAEEYTNSVGMTFRRIPAGSFTMGYPLDKTDHRINDQNPHQVNITSPFYIQTTEVTQEQYKSVMGYNPSTHANCGGKCPVDSVTWYDAMEFVRRLNVKENTNEYSLPTEEQWEYACRADSDSTYCFGDDAGMLKYYAWYDYNSGWRPHEAGQKRPNDWGLYDMHGSVFEWCRNKVGRGGSWKHPASLARSTLRVPAYKDLRILKEDDLGFRVARD